MTGYTSTAVSNELRGRLKKFVKGRDSLSSLIDRLLTIAVQEMEFDEKRKQPCEHKYEFSHSIENEAVIKAVGYAQAVWICRKCGKAKLKIDKGE